MFEKTMIDFIVAQICGLLLVSFIIYLTNKKKCLKSKSLYAYKYALYTTFVSLILDINSVFFIININKIPIIAIDAACKAYLLSLVGVAFLAFNYLMTNLHYNSRLRKVKKYLSVVIIISALAIVFLPINIYYDAISLYTYGPSVIATYISSLFFIITTFVCTFLISKQINKLRIFSVRLWLTIWLLAAVTQLLNNRLLLAGFAGSLGLTIVFGEIENPITYIDTDTNLFNLKAIKNYAGEFFASGKDVYGISIFMNTFAKKLTPQETKQITTYLANGFNALTNIFFRIDSNSYILMCKKQEVDYYLRKLQELIDQAPNEVAAFNGISVHYGVIREDKVFANLEDITNVFYYLRTVKDEEVTYVTKDLLEKLRAQEIMKKEISDALEEHRIKVFYQPIYDTRTHTFTSVEALARMYNKNGDLVSPAQFIPAAENSGLIVPLSERVFERVCEMLSENSEEECGLKYAEVNLSALQFEQPDFFDKFYGIIQKYNVDPKRINFELTESIQLIHNKEVGEAIKKFREIGVNFSIDDFGTGTSNLEYIATFPINLVKFDYNMTRNYFVSDKTKIIMKHIVPMIQEMNYEIVCEGVEEKEQLETMESLGIEHIQGFYFSKPIPREELVKFLHENNNK